MLYSMYNIPIVVGGRMSLDNRYYKLKIIRSKRKTIAIQIASSDEVVVRSPYRMSMVEIERFIDKHKLWIEKNLSKMKELEAAQKKERKYTEAEIRELAEAACRVIPERVRHYAPIVGVDYGNITIRNQKTRWGSCTATGNLNFNVAIMRAPLEIMDYVVVHELCHRLHMNHSTEYWKEVERVMPEYKKYEKWLKEHVYMIKSFT